MPLYLSLIEYQEISSRFPATLELPEFVTGNNILFRKVQPYSVAGMQGFRVGKNTIVVSVNNGISYPHRPYIYKSAVEALQGMSFVIASDILFGWVLYEKAEGQHRQRFGNKYHAKPLPLP